MPTPPLSRAKHARIHELLAEGLSYDQVAAKAKVGFGTVTNYAKRPLPPEPKLPDPRTASLPASIAKSFPPVHLDTPGWWLVLGDLHLPYHDRRTVELAVAEARKRRAVGVLLNGDALDSHEVSRHDRDPSAMRYIHEVEVGKEFLAWLRRQCPKAELVYKLGNHDERIDSYVIQRAPALFGLEGLNLESLLHFDHYGVTGYRDKRLLCLGKLNVLHGHEYRGGAGAGPVNPARGLYLKARSVALCGHHHRTSEHHSRNVKGEAEAAWSAGCACDLSPRWLPFNDWNLGFAFVKVAAGGGFEVDNKRVLSGKVV